MKKENIKTGRNEPCPCNSGKKFKKCCLNKKLEQDKPQSRIFQTHQLILNKFFTSNKFNIYTEKGKFERKILASITESEKPSNIANLLKEYLVICENFIEEIASKHSRYNLLFWSRRLGPKNLFNVADLSVMIYREIQALSIYKFGSSKEDLVTNNKIGTIPKNIEKYYDLKIDQLNEILKKNDLSSEVTSIISDVIRIEILSYLYLNVTQLYRISNKGGIIKINETRNNFTCETSKDISFLIDLYDDRLSKSNLFSMTGAYVFDSIKNSNLKIFCPHLQLNVDHKLRIPLYNAKTASYNKFFKENETIEIESNYLLGGINLNNIYSFFIIFKDEFKKRYNFTVEDFVVFLAFLGNKLVGGIIENIEFQIHILNRAYSVYDFDINTFGKEFIEKYSEIYKLIFNKDVNENHLKGLDQNILIDNFLLKSSNQKDLDLWTRGPKRIFYQLSNNNMVIDYTSLADILTYTAKDLTRVDGDIGNRRAENFEDLLILEINNNYSQDQIWINKQVIEANGLRKEIDATLIIQDVLFILEAKAVNVSFGFDKGDKKALDFRINKMKKAIEESNEKAHFVKTHKNDLVIKLPENINYICPLVISSNPEYIWSKTDELFLSLEDSIPRILTINDIGNTLKNVNIDSIKKKKWVVEIENSI